MAPLLSTLDAEKPLTAPSPSLTPAQKRAASYANTINTLFTEILDSRQSADRVLANYFRSNKKHGSKDRRVIRETLFALFRWWGWLQQLENGDKQSLWFQRLALAAAIEAHPWTDIICAWQQQAGKSFALPEQALAPKAAAALVFKVSGRHVLVRDLAPDWFWQAVAPLPEAREEELIDALCSRPPIWARVQNMPLSKALAELRSAGVDASAAPVFNDAISLGSKSINLNEIKLYKEGFIEVQDLASQVIGQVCAPRADENWWDACSGAGGKSLQLSSLMQQDNAAKGVLGTITASDIRPAALNELEKRAKRAGFNIEVAPWRSDALPVAREAFDGVLVDAPCSCTGTWRRNPDMRWLDDSQAISDKPALQLDILSRACDAVKPGGTLVYATCSLADSENRQVVDAFLAKRPEFTLETLSHPFSGEQTQYLTIWPFEANADGMFVVRFRKQV
ncbi:RsmB/NOP family class I SAM-dependent RNA methyltransferase [Shewanella algae]|nr:RsmB/NOP family class I SAM-dependent RNA methyltransferase [Shewanella algae]